MGEPSEQHRDKETKMKIDFTGGSVYVRENLSFKFRQKVTTENGVPLEYRCSARIGNIRWFKFRNKEGKEFWFRMMAFPYMHAMGEKIELRDNIGPIDIRVSVVKSINRELVRLLK